MPGGDGLGAGPLEHLVTYRYAHGVSDGRFALFLARGASEVGDPTDPAEADRVEWVPVAEVRRLVSSGGVPDGLSLTALLWMLAFGLLAE